ncbi:MAG: hypothetical protein RBT59_11360 [Arcobacteraceae bacterium]|jgi:hypothetical protein|nr:hypothetical protein [Arcobacteraceae bacterium]
MKRGMVAMSIVAVMGMSNMAFADNMTERFANHVKYTEYKKALDSNNKEKAYEIKKEMAIEICDSIIVQVIEESNSLAKKGIKARYDLWDIQTKVNFVNIYLKSKQILVNEDKRSTFNPNISAFIESIYYKTGQSLDTAKDIQSKFVFNDNNVFINDLLEIGKIADETYKIKKETNELKKETNELKRKEEVWKEIIERLNKL